MCKAATLNVLLSQMRLDVGVKVADRFEALALRVGDRNGEHVAQLGEQSLFDLIRAKAQILFQVRFAVYPFNIIGLTSLTTEDEVYGPTDDEPRARQLVRRERESVEGGRRTPLNAGVSVRQLLGLRLVQQFLPRPAHLTTVNEHVVIQEAGGEDGVSVAAEGCAADWACVPSEEG